MRPLSQNSKYKTLHRSPSDQICPSDILFILNKHSYMQKEYLDHWVNNNLKTFFLITMYLSQKHDLFSQFSSK